MHDSDAPLPPPTYGHVDTPTCSPHGHTTSNPIHPPVSRPCQTSAFPLVLIHGGHTLRGHPGHSPRHGKIITSGPDHGACIGCSQLTKSATPNRTSPELGRDVLKSQRMLHGPDQRWTSQSSTYTPCTKRIMGLQILRRPRS